MTTYTLFDNIWVYFLLVVKYKLYYLILLFSHLEKSTCYQSKVWPNLTAPVLKYFNKSLPVLLQKIPEHIYINSSHFHTATCSQKNGKCPFL